MGKKIVITQSNYIPWKGYFDSLNMVDMFIAYDDMQFTKRDWRNRNKIKTAQGTQWLSVPVEVSGKFHQKINETRVSDPSWNVKHWKTLANNYARAEAFRTEKVFIEGLYNSCTFDNLTEINLHFLRAIADRLGIQTPIVDSREFDLVEGKTERLVDLCKKMNATDYYTGPAARNYMDEGLFAAEGIAVHYFDYGGYPEYPQLFPPFDHAVTVLDLLFNVGDQASRYLKSTTA